MRSDYDDALDRAMEDHFNPDEAYYDDGTVTLHQGDALDIARTLPDGAVRCIVTSPPYYGLRDYGESGQYGGESSVHEYVATMVALFRELRRVLADDGTLWLNLGDSYTGSWGAQSRDAHAGMHTSVVESGSYARNHGRTGSRREGEPPAKNLLGVPWRVALALQEDGWILRSDIIWHKPNPMPESVTDRPTKAHEYLFLLTKSPRYYYNSDAIAEDAVGGAKGSRFDTGKTADHQLGRAQSGERPQTRRALDLAREHGLTDAHIAAVKAVGMADAGKARIVQSGTGKNDAEVIRLAAEAKTALGGYYREFLTGGKVNKRTVWTVPTVPFGEAHFAVYPPDLIRPCILAGTEPGDVVLDPFSGSGTTGMVATEEGRKYVGFDLNAEYLDLSLRTRFAQPTLGIAVTA
jgi:DNA modification methylase